MKSIADINETHKSAAASGRADVPPDLMIPVPLPQHAALLSQHAALLDASAITPVVAEARGYRSVTTHAELQSYGFTRSQTRVPALLMPLYGVTGEIDNYIIRPDMPRIVRGKTIKYEIPHGSRMVLDVPPWVRPGLGKPDVPLLITEGVRKADAAVSAGLWCIDIIGVWNWRGTNEHGGTVALPEWESIALNGRVVYLAFDSDFTSKPEVYNALKRLKEFLEHRRANVQVIYLPAGPGGVKVGLDDYLTADHSVDDLFRLASTALRPPPDDDRDRATYVATPGGLMWQKPTKDGPVQTRLTNFIATIVGDVLEDDGAEVRHRFEIEARLGDRTTRFSVAAAQFYSMGWVPEHLGAQAIVSPGQTTRDHARTSIQTLSGNIPERRVFMHTGWRRIGDEWLYLSAGGGIGAAGLDSTVDVALGGNLGNFALPEPPTGTERIVAVRTSLALFLVAPMEVTAPLLGAVYLAPLGEPLGSQRPDFTLWFEGQSGKFKSELAALAQAHFGPFTQKTMPTSFTATANAVERILFIVKDALLVVDDYHPATDPREAQAMNHVATRLLRGVGNAGGRGRMRADTTLQVELRPRALPLVTGERVPSGHSTAARMFLVPVAPDAVDRAKLTVAQEHRGFLPSAMAAYLQWLARQFEQLQVDLPRRFEALRDAAQHAGAHAREPGQVAHLFMALELFFRFATEIGAVTSDHAEQSRASAWGALTTVAAARREDLADESPVQRFLALLGDGFASRRAYVGTYPSEEPPRGADAWGWERGPTGEYGHAPGAACLGWLDVNWLYLLSEATYRFIVSQARAAGETFPVEHRTLLKRLDEDGLIATQGDRRTVNVRTATGTTRVIKLRRNALSAGPAA